MAWKRGAFVHQLNKSGERPSGGGDCAWGDGEKATKDRKKRSKNAKKAHHRSPTPSSRRVGRAGEPAVAWMQDLV